MVSGVVLDASAAIAVLLKEEAAPQVEAALRRIREGECLVPSIWRSEARNALLAAERRGRISAEDAAERLRSMESLLIADDDSPDLDAAMTLARAHSLSFYDALYLELTLRRGAVLVSLDAALLRAAQREGVATL